MKRLAFVLVILSLACAAYGDVQDQKVVRLVDQALELFQTPGKDLAVKMINDSAGPLRKASIYVFAVDFKGHFIAHPVQDDLRDHDGWELQDAKGKFITQEFIKIAESKGQGWCKYWWIRVGETVPKLKKTYIKKVPGEYILVGAGYYIK